MSGTIIPIITTPTGMRSNAGNAGFMKFSGVSGEIAEPAFATELPQALNFGVSMCHARSACVGEFLMDGRTTIPIATIPPCKIFKQKNFSVNRPC